MRMNKNGIPVDERKQLNTDMNFEAALLTKLDNLVDTAQLLVLALDNLTRRLEDNAS